MSCLEEDLNTPSQDLRIFWVTDNEKCFLFLMEYINTLSFLYPYVSSLRAGCAIFIMYYSSEQLLNTNPGLKVNRCFNIFCMEVVFTANVLHNLTGIVNNKGGKA